MKYTYDIIKYEGQKQTNQIASKGKTNTNFKS